MYTQVNGGVIMEKIKSEYTAPEIEVIEFTAADVITASPLVANTENELPIQLS